MSEQRAFPCCVCGKEFYLVSLSDEDAESYDEVVSMGRYDDYLGCMVPNVSSFEAWLGEHEEYEDNYHACSDCGSDS
ncbi:hypothetical protein ABLV17_07455 [Klebsiella sp. CN_Kp091]|uniref:hypothetical protein n=1 Tax=unclassified Klebsiella TaxID=2608929 RepID=UPI0032B34C5C